MCPERSKCSSNHPIFSYDTHQTLAWSATGFLLPKDVICAQTRMYFKFLVLLNRIFLKNFPYSLTGLNIKYFSDSGVLVLKILNDIWYQKQTYSHFLHPFDCLKFRILNFFLLLRFVFLLKCHFILVFPVIIPADYNFYQKDVSRENSVETQCLTERYWFSTMIKTGIKRDKNWHRDNGIYQSVLYKKISNSLATIFHTVTSRNLFCSLEYSAVNFLIKFWISSSPCLHIIKISSMLRHQTKGFKRLLLSISCSKQP